MFSTCAGGLGPRDFSFSYTPFPFPLFNLLSPRILLIRPPNWSGSIPASWGKERNREVIFPRGEGRDRVLFLNPASISRGALETYTLPTLPVSFLEVTAFERHLGLNCVTKKSLRQNQWIYALFFFFFFLETLLKSRFFFIYNLKSLFFFFFPVSHFPFASLSFYFRELTVKIFLLPRT